MDEWHKLRQEISRVRATHSDLLAELAETRPFRQGSVVRRWSVCGKAGCRCQRGEKHGPFWYLCRSEGGRSRMQYLRKAKAGPVVAQVQTYQRWRRLRLRLRRVQRETEAVLDRLGDFLAAAAEGGVQGWHTPSGVRLQRKPGPRS